MGDREARSYLKVDWKLSLMLESWNLCHFDVNLNKAETQKLAWRNKSISIIPTEHHIIWSVEVSHFQ